MDPTVSTKPGENLKSFFSSPFVGFVGAVASIISVPLAIYFYFKSVETREVAYSISPNASSVVKKSGTSKLSVLFGGRAVDSDISIVQVAIWNKGKLSAKREHLLSPVTVQATDSSRILEVVAKSTRDIISISIDTASGYTGTIKLIWSILEENDGVLLQITYAGPTYTTFLVHGVVEGQRTI